MAMVAATMQLWPWLGHMQYDLVRVVPGWLKGLQRTRTASR